MLEYGLKEGDKMRIGLDIDGVLINQEKFQLKHGIKFFKKKYINDYNNKNNKKIKLSEVQVYDLATKTGYDGKPIDFTKHFITIDSNGYGIDDIFLCDSKDEEKFWYRYMLKYALFAPFRKDASMIVNRLVKEGNIIYPITSRAKANENNIVGKIQRTILVLRLKLNKIPYEKITYCSYKNGQEKKDKVAACIGNDLDIVIEDKKANAEAITIEAQIPTFLYATKNNADIKSKRTTRFVNFLEMYNGIKKYQAGKSFTTLDRNQKSLLTKEERQKYYEGYRKYVVSQDFDKDIILARAKKIKKVTKRGRYIFDKTVKHRAINLENVATEDGIIITTNHRDMLDIPLVMRHMGSRPYVPMLKSEFLDTKAEGFFTEMGCIFINRNDRSIREQARETAVKRVLTGHNVIVCPEGTRNKTDKPLLDFDFGAVSIAQNSGRPIYPCAIHKTKTHKIINFGKKIDVGMDDDLAEVNRKLFDVTLQLLRECQESEKQREETEKVLTKK